MTLRFSFRVPLLLNGYGYRILDEVFLARWGRFLILAYCFSFFVFWFFVVICFVIVMRRVRRIAMTHLVRLRLLFCLNFFSEFYFSHTLRSDAGIQIADCDGKYGKKTPRLATVDF